VGIGRRVRLLAQLLAVGLSFRALASNDAWLSS